MIVVRRLEGNLTANKVSLALEALESLDAFMPTLERMPNLIDLDLHGNKLTKLPKDMSKLRKLRSLNLRHNNFPSVQGILPSLTTLRRSDPCTLTPQRMPKKKLLLLVYQICLCSTGPICMAMRTNMNIYIVEQCKNVVTVAMKPP